MEGFSWFLKVPENMFLKKISSEQRSKIRLQRQENHLIRTRAKQRSFVYVVNPPEKPRVVFGSTLERDVLPLKGPSVSSFMRRQMGDILLSPGPTARVDGRDHLEIKCPSKLGHSAFASKLPRLSSTQSNNLPCVGSYEVQAEKPLKKSFKPFNVGSLRAEFKKFQTPAPNSYLHQNTRPLLKVNLAFGTQRKISPTVQTICSPFNTAQCHKCHHTPLGDYWHSFDEDLDLCRPCRRKIESQLKSCTTNELQRLRLRRFLQFYCLVRYCGFLHDHNGTNAATQLLPTKILKFKIKKENYLSLYV